MAKKQLSHVDSSGKLRMVDVSAKQATRRTAQASCVVRTDAEIPAPGTATHALDVLHAARIAGIQAAKQTANLIPLCHPLSLHDVQVDVTKIAHGVNIQSTVVTVDHTGVEMEALTACAVAALSVVSSLLDLDPTARMDDLVLLRKTGGKSGEWGRLVDPPQ
jgi:cyclic pyranopterin phosphate synthase